ncbi:hypothetical protein ET445_14550 [Agromyces protaetiae]|uniref:Uncharacterized protein n=1 Tax=Agromyces protaetiae TaxID=2509455 RepID=A0A4P6FK56_9MICO|nr:hypothetical protein [Agromyces protaetiae]QAY74367.1 hypothetical protein ET445_14550 [Agromyces protaetiae]
MTDEDTQNLISVGHVIGEIATIAVGEVPVVGTPLSFVLEKLLGTAFGEVEDEQPPVWELIRGQVAHEIWTAKVDERRDLLKVKLDALKASVAKLALLHDEGSSSYIAELVSRETHVRENIDTYFMPDDPALAYYTLPFFMPIANAHLALLRLKVLWAERRSDANTSAYRDDYQATVRTYGLYAKHMPAASVAWRMSQITITDVDESFTSFALQHKKGALKGVIYTYTDAEKPDTNETSDKSAFGVPPKFTRRRDDVFNRSESLMKSTVASGLVEWGEFFDASAPVAAHLFTPVDVHEETWIEPSGEIVVTAAGDEIALRNRRTREVLWGRQVPGKRLFLSVTPQEFAIRSGFPHTGGELEERLFTAKRIDGSTSARIERLILGTDGTLALSEGFAMENGSVASETVWYSPDDVEKTTQRVKRSAKMRIATTTFTCLFSDESASGPNEWKDNRSEDRAEVVELRLAVQVGGGPTWKVADWSAGFFQSALEVRPGWSKTFRSDEVKSLDLGADPATVVRFTVHTSEHDSLSPNDTADHEFTMTVGDILTRVQRFGGRYRWAHSIDFGNNEVEFRVQFGFEVDAR